jgi:hypothetical protein
MYIYWNIYIYSFISVFLNTGFIIFGYKWINENIKDLRNNEIRLSGKKKITIIGK